MRANLLSVFVWCACLTPSLAFPQEVEATHAEATSADATEWIVPQAMKESDSFAAEASAVILTEEEAAAELVPPTPSDVLSEMKVLVLGAKTALPALSEFQGYRTGSNGLAWMVGNGDQFGDFAFWDDIYQPAGIASGLELGLAMHFLAGPDQTDMPPRLYNFMAGYQKRNVVGNFAYDVAVAVNAASDFEGSSRQGIRFPAHAVGYLALWDNLDLAFGGDFLDWAAIHWLPVFGVVWCPNPDLRLELVFPSPRVDLQLTETHRLYLAGGLGGGTWAVERDSEVDDLVTYYDLRATVGLETAYESGGWHAWEVAVLFDRELQFTSQEGDFSPNATVLVRSITRY